MENRFKAEEAANYDDVIKRRTPLYSEMQTLMASLLPFSKKEYLRVLDLGCGTGGTSIALLKEFPLARVTGVDGSREMLEIAKGKVKHTTWRIDFICQDVREFGRGGVTPPVQQLAEGSEEYDVIISAFTLHFLSEDEKRTVLGACMNALKSGGMFIDAEAIRSSSERVYNSYMDRWKDFQQSNGFTEEEIGAQMIKFIRDVKPLTIERQVDLMKKAGFSDVECYFKYMNWAVFGGYK